MSQLFQPDQAMRMTLDDAFGHNMVGVLFQPSLSSTDRHQATGSRTSAFFLKTLAQSCIMIGFGHNGFAREEGARSLHGTGHGQIAYSDIHPHEVGVLLGSRLWHFDLKGDQQVELLV